MCGRAAGGGGREVGGSAQPKTRTPQKDVGKNSCNTEVLYSIILVGGFNPSEKYEFVGLDNHPSYWGDISVSGFPKGRKETVITVIPQF